MSVLTFCKVVELLITAEGLVFFMAVTILSPSYFDRQVRYTVNTFQVYCFSLPTFSLFQATSKLLMALKPIPCVMHTLNVLNSFVPKSYSVVTNF